MTMPMFTRFTNLRNIVNINVNAIGSIPSNVQCTINHQVIVRRYTTDNNDTEFVSNPELNEQKGIFKEKMSKAMAAYLQRSEEHENFMKKETAVFEIGKRHLANIMGENPENFSQKEINRAIKYLFPSGIFDVRARPTMRDPTSIFPVRKAAEFDKAGRPFHSMFYTTLPNYNELLYNVVDTIYKLNDLEDARRAKGILPSPADKMDEVGSSWLTQENLEKRLSETLKIREYEYMVASWQRLIEHPLSNHAADFIKQYRKIVNVMSKNVAIPPLSYDSNGRPFITVPNCMRKSARGEVTIRGNGTGKITINGKDIMYFENVQCREQIIFPLNFTDMIDKVDVEATVRNGGPSGQSGAIRWGIAWGLRNFVDTDMIEKMRIAGLLTRDWRRRERKKFGQEGARRKFTWKKR